MKNSDKEPEFVALNMFDFAIDALLYIRDYNHVTTFFKLPKRIRQLIKRSFRGQKSWSAGDWSFGVIEPAIRWSYNELPMTMEEVEIEKYLKSLSRSSDEGCVIYINQASYDSYLVFLQDCEDACIDKIDE